MLKVVAVAVAMDVQSDATLEFAAPPEDAGAVGSDEDLEAPERRTSRLLGYGGVVLLAAGWIVLYLGYNGAATNPLEVAQIPYVVSGGLGGLALILLGGMLLLARVLVGMQAALRSEVVQLRAAIEEATDALARSPAAGIPANGLVVALRGGSSFHRPSCRLVAEKPGLRRIPQPEAVRRGLVPCRVCKP